MTEIILETLIDGLKLIPFLFLAFLLIEIIEHKLTGKSKKIISKSGKFGPIVGSALGMFPQCGFSAMATNLYVTRIISLGTLISKYLKTSDEMLPILISQNVEISIILKILGVKFIIGIIYGLIIDLILRKKEKTTETDFSICEDENCNCNCGGGKGRIVLSALKHTGNTILFIVIISFIINIIFEYFGEEFLSTIFLKDSIFGPFISSLVGLIPNCGASVMITQLYLNNAISFGSTIAGLLTGSGVALLILFKTNKNIKENLAILGTLYFLGAFTGVLIEIFQILIN